MKYEPFIQKSWAVFPLAPGTKSPFKKTDGPAGGFHEAVRDEGLASRLFADKPGCNIGVATGAMSGVFVVDCDQDEAAGKLGLDNFSKLAEPHGGLDETFYVTTPRGGVHFYYQMPGDGLRVPCSVGRLAPNVDIRGDGGYVVGEGSVVNGKTYTAGNACEPAPAPAWLLEMIARKSAPRERIKKSLVKANAAWLKDALTKVPASCDYETWLSFGMALHDWDEAAGLELWRDWSASSPEKFEAGLCERKWDSFGGSGYTVGTIFHAARANGWAPPPAVDLRESITNTLTGKAPAFKKHEAICKAVVTLLCEQGQLFYHQELKDCASCMYFDASRKALFTLHSDLFRAWLSDFTGVNKACDLFRHIMSAVETAALSGDRAQGTIPQAYWSRRGDAIYLSNGDGAMVRITRDGLDLVDNGTDGVLFAAGRTLAPWKHDAEPRDIFRESMVLYNFAGSEPHGRDLFKAWLYSLPTDPINKPILCPVGEIGSGKTRILQATAEFFGIPFRASKAADSGENDFWVAMDAGGLFILDNVDSNIKWLADNAANASTGGRSERRKLYTNNETVRLGPKSWLALTTANPQFAQDAGLADRLLVLKMGRASKNTADSQITEEILGARDRGLVHLALTLAAALREAPPAEVFNRRHPDFSSFAYRIGKALGEADAFARALRAGEAAKAAFCLENDLVMDTLIQWLTDHEEGFSGSMTELVECLKSVELNTLEWLNSRKLGRKLNAHWSFLVARLKVCEFNPSAKKRSYKFVLGAEDMVLPAKS